MLAIVITLMICGAAAAMDITIAADPPLPAANLLQNAQMEDGEGGAPHDWRWTTAIPENFTVGWTENGRGGKCLSLEAHSAEMSGYWTQSVKVTPDADYLLTGWFRLDGGKILVYAHATAPDGRTVNERYYASSMRNHFLIPVFLNPRYAAGIAPEAWNPFRIPFHVPGNLNWISVSAGMYFQSGEVWFDDFRVTPAKTNLSVKVQADKDMARVRLLLDGQDEPILDVSVAGDNARYFERSVMDVSTEGRYVVEVTSADGEIYREVYPEEAHVR